MKMCSVYHKEGWVKDKVEAGNEHGWCSPSKTDALHLHFCSELLNLQGKQMKELQLLSHTTLLHKKQALLRFSLQMLMHCTCILWLDLTGSPMMNQN